MTLRESQNQAIAEAQALNVKLGFHKWKTVSLNSDGYWFADECEWDKMKANHSQGCFFASCGSDIVLNAKFTETPICDWVRSVASVPV